MLPTAEQVLSNLPLAITLWTAATLCWGLYILTAYNKMMKRALQFDWIKTRTDRYHSMFIMAGNAVLVAFLMLEPSMTQYSDAVIVTNIFFGTYLAATSTALVRWWKTDKTTQTRLLS